MRKFIFFLTLAAMLCLGSCSSCSHQEQPVEPETVAALVVENTISADREYMFLNYGENYSWYESYIVLKDFLDSEECDGTIESVSNVFQVVVEEETGADAFAVFSNYTLDSYGYEVREGIWVGDFSLNSEEIKLTFEEAFQKIQEVNAPKPHSRHCVLRREVGPVPNVNPQYVFGNNKAQLYVDVVTGEVSDVNPAFNVPVE